MLAALAHAQLLHRHGAGNAGGDLAGRLERGVQAVKQAYSQCPSWEELVPALLDHPLEVYPLLTCCIDACKAVRSVHSKRIKALLPCKPMLGLTHAAYECLIGTNPSPLRLSVALNCTFASPLGGCSDGLLVARGLLLFLNRMLANKVHLPHRWGCAHALCYLPRAGRTLNP